jgi:hypothetical protein
MSRRIGLGASALDTFSYGGRIVSTDVLKTN